MPEDSDKAQTGVAETQPSGAPQDGGFDPAGWLQGLDTRQRAAIDEYAAFRTKPIESELHGLRTENGRLKKAADPAHAARLADEERLLGHFKTAAIALYGVEDADFEGVDTIDQFATALRFMSKAAKTQPAAKQEKPPDADAALWQEFMASRKGGAATPQQQRGASGEVLMRGGGVAPTAIPDNDFIRAYADGDSRDHKRAQEILSRMGVR